MKYDSDRGLTVGAIRDMLRDHNGKNFRVKLVFLGTNAELNNNLDNPMFIVNHDRIRLNGSMFKAFLIEMKSEDDARAAEVVKIHRPGVVIKRRQLTEIIENHGFVRFVSGNHINGAKEKGMEMIEGVREQQLRQIIGKTLFIDPLFNTTGSESQYHDILTRDGAEVESDSSYPLEIVTAKDGSVCIGILRTCMYNDEVDSLEKITVKHYINETRPLNVLEE